MISMNLNDQEGNPATWIEKRIKDFINTSPANTLQNKQHDKAWGDPLVGFSRGDDPLFQFFKEHIGPFHLTPEEIFTQTFPSAKITPDQLTIISWVLPHMQETKSDNRKETVYPAERWARARIYGEESNRKLCGHVVETLHASGYNAVAPMLSPFFEVKQSQEYGFSSTWSERHAAYVSGLGTFGLSDGLITPKGKAMRCGSVVAHITIPPSNRSYQDHNAYCLFHSKGLCGKCIQRCPVGAITEAGHDKITCEHFLIPTTAEYVRSHYRFKGYGCGLCQTNVPCESKIPTKADLPEKKRTT
jgi:epoxyqueuosine reductase